MEDDNSQPKWEDKQAGTTGGGGRSIGMTADQNRERIERERNQ